MKIFGPLYERAMKWAAHERAPTYLTVLSFFEAIIFPVMPEVMLAPMCVAQPKRGWWFATLSLAGSMVGALVGYALGHYAFEAIKPLFEALGMLPAIEQGITTVQAKMAESPWAVFTFLDDHEIVPFDRADAVADRVMELAKANHTKLVSG